MSRDYLTPGQLAALGRAKRCTVLSITLGDGTPLKLATEEVEFGDDLYLPKLAPVDALNLELTAAVEGIDLKVANTTLALGRNLINTPDMLSGTQAVLGVYFSDPVSGLEWIDEKITGEIIVGDIDGDWVNIFFTSKVDAVEYAGIAVAALFPDSQIAAAPVVQPVYNDISNNPAVIPGAGNQSPVLTNDFQTDERYFLPVFQLE